MPTPPDTPPKPVAANGLPHASDLDTGQVSRTFSKGLRVLETLAESDEPMTAQEIARKIGSDRAIVYRMLRTLSMHGLLSESEGPGKFSLGLRLLTLARHVQADVRRAAQPILEELAERLNATAFLGVLDAHEIVCFVAVEPRKANVMVRYREGIRRPEGVGASGVAIQMLDPPSASDSAALQQARRLGYATSVETLESGTAALSAPVGAPIHGERACVTLVYPMAEDRDTPASAAALIDAAKAITAAVAH